MCRRNVTVYNVYLTSDLESNIFATYTELSILLNKAGTLMNIVLLPVGGEMVAVENNINKRIIRNYVFVMLCFE